MLELPKGSVAVRVTVFAPVFAQVKLLVLSERLCTKQLSVLPLSTSPVVIEAVPLPFK